jgi:hypothetical protein
MVVQCAPFYAFSTCAAIFNNATPPYNEGHLCKNIFGDYGTVKEEIRMKDKYTKYEIPCSISLGLSTS